MAEYVIVPKIGVTVTNCIIESWHFKKGDQVKKGEVLFSYETDKTCMDEESPFDGVLLDIFYQDGDEVPCLERVCVIGEPGEDYEIPGGGTSAAAQAKGATVSDIDISITEEDYKRKYSASPRARLLAKRLNVSLNEITPTGPENRIVGLDVEMAAKINMGSGTQTGQKQQTADDKDNIAYSFTDTKIKGVRKVIACRMSESMSQIPQLTHNVSFDATCIINLRTELKKSELGEEFEKVSINDMIVYAASRVLPKHPNLNAHFINGDTIRVFDDVHIGVATDTERGLMVPVLHNAQKYSLIEMSLSLRKLIKEAREGAIMPDKLTNGSFTISNVGSMRVESFTPIINPPQTGILGVCCPVYRIKPTAGGTVTYPAITLSLTYDHRAIDGAPASRFLIDMADFLERFNLMQLK